MNILKNSRYSEKFEKEGPASKCTATMDPGN